MRTIADYIFLISSALLNCISDVCSSVILKSTVHCFYDHSYFMACIVCFETVMIVSS